MVDLSTMEFAGYWWQSTSSVFAFLFMFVAAILWSYIYSSTYFKLTVGFISAAISFGILYIIPSEVTEQHTILYIASILFLAISETYIGPVVHSTLTKHSNPKYLAILISLAFIPSRLFSWILGFFNESLNENTSLAITIAFVAMTIVSLTLIFLYRKSKHNRKTNIPLVNKEH